MKIKQPKKENLLTVNTKKCFNCENENNKHIVVNDEGYCVRCGKKITYAISDNVCVHEYFVKDVILAKKVISKSTSYGGIFTKEVTKSIPVGYTVGEIIYKCIICGHEKKH